MTISSITIATALAPLPQVTKELAEVVTEVGPVVMNQICWQINKGFLKGSISLGWARSPSIVV